MRLWIENGAPRDATVAGTADLLNAGLPPPQPIQIDPLPPPDPTAGVQIHMPRWIVGANSEHEVCYASYYDISGQVPPEYLNSDGTAMRFNQQEIRQDPLSHHLIVNLYNGTTPITDKSWGTFLCRGGAADGTPCNPLDMPSTCGADSGCANDPVVSVGCFGTHVEIPSDAAVGVAASGFTGTQKAATTITYAPGVYQEMPLKGIFISDSHAFNTTAEDGKLEAWLNFYFAPKDQQQYPVQAIFATTNPGSKNPFEVLFKPDVPVFTAEECAGAPRESKLPPTAGDCNGDLTVTIDELILSVNIVLGQAPLSSCPRLDMTDKDTVNVANLVAAVSSALNPGMRDLWCSPRFRTPQAANFSRYSLGVR